MSEKTSGMDSVSAVSTICGELPAAVNEAFQRCFMVSLSAARAYISRLMRSSPCSSNGGLITSRRSVPLSMTLLWYAGARKVSNLRFTVV